MRIKITGGDDQYRGRYGEVARFLISHNMKVFHHPNCTDGSIIVVRDTFRFKGSKGTGESQQSLNNRALLEQQVEPSKDLQAEMKRRFPWVRFIPKGAA